MNYHEISPEMTIGDLVKSNVYGDFANYIFTDMTPDHWNCPLKDYGYEKVGFEQTLHRMEELASTKDQYIYHIYDEETRLSQWDKEKPVLLHFPGPEAGLPYAVVIPGGGFNRQWGLIEGMAIAAELNRQGYTAFVLYYRTKIEPVIPKAIEDMHQAIRFIEEHASTFSVQKGHYILGGFSAGATLAGEMGSTNFGWKTAGLPKPEMIFLGYTAIDMKLFFDTYQKFPLGHPAHTGMSDFLRRIGGPEFTWDDLAPYHLVDFMDETYPPVYLTANEDDGTVPFSNSLLMEAACKKSGIPCQCKFGKTGGHSYGLGVGLSVEGWLTDALAFWKSLPSD